MKNLNQSAILFVSKFADGFITFTLVETS